jgi:hypothetical protein
VGFLFGIADNRKVSLERGKLLQVKHLEIPESGLVVYLKEFGWVKVFCQSFKNEPRYYIMYHPDSERLNQLTRTDFKQVHDAHWQIECFHRVIKQVCNIERFYVRNEAAIRNHFYCALRAFSKLQTLSLQGVIRNCYAMASDLFIPVIRQFIRTHAIEATFA